MAKTGRVSPKFSLPKTTLKGIVQILRIYGTSSLPMTVADAASKLGTHSTAVSRNSKFLVNTGLIAGSAKRSLTALGRQLSSALSSDEERDIQRGWRTLVDQTPFLRDCIATLTVRPRLPTKRFLDHIISTSGEVAGQDVLRGARAVMDILVHAGVVHEQDGSVRAVSKPESNGGEATENDESGVPERASHSRVSEQLSSVSGPMTTPTGTRGGPLDTKGALMSTIAINVELHVPATEDYGIYEKLFRALRVELLERAK